MKKFIVFAIAALIVSGCASKPYQSDPDKSYALNVFTAAAGNTYLRDVSQEKFREIQEEAEQTRKIEGSESGLGGTLLATWAGGLLRGVAYWGVGEEATEENQSGIVIWMPKHEAQTPEQARKKIKAIVDEAAAKAVAETSFPEWVQEVRKISSTTYEVVGEKPFQGDVACKYNFGWATQPPNEGHAPDFLGGSAAWTYIPDNPHMWGVPWFSCANNDRSVFKAALPDYEVYVNWSKNLPEWAFIYLAPSNLPANFISKKTSYGYDFLNYPVVLNQGKVYYFVSKK